MHFDFSKILPVLSSVAPFLAGMIGGPFATVGVTTLETVLGLAPGTTAADGGVALTDAVLSMTPAQAVQLAQTDADLKSKMIEAATLSDTAQGEINKAALSSGFFQSGWRPMTAWICVVAFASNYVFLPNLTWCLGLFGILTVTPPALDLSVMLPVLAGLLGLGGLRTIERVQGVKGA